MTPTKNESLPELVARWRELAREARSKAEGSPQYEQECYAECGAYEECADELEAALTREASTEGVSDPGRYFADGPQGHFFADALKLARDLVNAYDTSDDWTITDLHNPTGEATPAAPQRMAQGEDSIAVAEVYEDSTGLRFPRWAPTVRQLPEPGAKLYAGIATTKSAPDGFVLVPREPTPAMVSAWRASVPDDSCQYNANDENWTAWCSQSWARMIAAAAKPSGEKS